MRARLPTVTPAARSSIVRLLLMVVVATLALLPSLATPVAAGDFTTLQWANARIHLARAWQVVPGQGAGITICDADTGITIDHPDLRTAITQGEDMTNPTAPWSYADDDGHGTWTAGIMVARGSRIWGVAPAASLLVAKVLKHGTGEAVAITAGILWCIDQGAAVVNLSLDLPATPWDGFADVIRYGCARGVDFAAASGNNHLVAAPLDPVSVKSPCLIAVNASDQHDQLAGFSNLGENPRTVTAPGQAIISDWTDGSVALGSGTSASAPFVSGVLALLRSQGADAPTAVNMVLASARHPRGVRFVHGRNPWLGAGILDAGAACLRYKTNSSAPSNVSRRLLPFLGSRHPRDLGHLVGHAANR
jgi:subtilisin family serine protease